MNLADTVEGYKTLIVAVLLAVIGGVCGHFGLVVDKSDQLALAALGFAIIMVIMRHISVGPAAWRLPPGSAETTQQLLSSVLVELQAHVDAHNPAVIDSGPPKAGFPAPP